MKYFKLVNGKGFPSFNEGQVYKGNYIAKGRTVTVRQYAEYFFPSDWLEVLKPKKTLSEKIEKLKKQAEKEGMKILISTYPEPNPITVDIELDVSAFNKAMKKALKDIKILKDHNPTFSATNPKDEWEFIIPNHNSTASKLPYRVQSKKEGFFQVYCPYSGLGNLTQLMCSEVNESTEQAYVEQLIAKAKELFGEIKEGDRLDRTGLGREDQSVIGVIGEWTSPKGFYYYKDEDYLSFNGTMIYRQGKWAKRVKERVRVKSFRIGSSQIVIDLNKEVESDVLFGLAQKLESYLNGEIE